LGYNSILNVFCSLMVEFIILFYYYFPRKCDTYPGSLYQSVCNKNLTLAITKLCHFSIFLHQTFKLYCLWKYKHNDAKFLTSRSHLPELCPFSLTFFLFWQIIRGRHKCSTEHPSSVCNFPQIGRTPSLRVDTATETWPMCRPTLITRYSRNTTQCTDDQPLSFTRSLSGEFGDD